MSNKSDEVMRLVKHTVSAWTLRDIDELMRYMAPNIDYYVNVDPKIAPFVASTSGAPALRARLQLLLDTFEIQAFLAKDIKISDEDPSVARVNISYVYRERNTKECLDGSFRMIVHTADGMIVRIAEIHDSCYVEAFARLVHMMQDTTES
ncbi:MAG: nuclear transport factor 2 family protein [Hyphomicrobiaceae bacterium]